MFLNRYWSKKKYELLAKIENIGKFHMFFTLSCGDMRFEENFTSLLKDHNISYVYNHGKEEVRIDGLSIDEFLEQNTTKHKFIMSNLLSATRNYNHRVKAFIKTIVMNACSAMGVKYWSYRVEFQLRGTVV